MDDGESVPAVLCGDLNMVRCFAGDAPRNARIEPTSIPFVVASSNHDDSTFASRYVDKRAIIADPTRDPEQTVHDLIVLSRSIGGRPTLFYGTDAMLLCVSRNRDRLAAYYRFLMPPADLVESLVCKALFAGLAQRLKLPVPRTVTSAEAKTASEVLARLSLPCALKPTSHTGWFQSAAVKQEGGLPRKALFARNETEFERRIEQMRSFSDDFVVQEYVPGPDENITSFHAWIDEQGQVVAHFIGKKIRTYPSGSGESTFLQLAIDEDATRMGLEIVQALGIVGVVKLDLKRHAETGKLLLLEANPRFNLWHYLGARSGVNLPLFAYASLTGTSMSKPECIQPGWKWISLDDDLRGLVRDHGPRGALSWPEWLLSLRGPMVYDAFAWDDPWPAAVSVFRQLETRFQRLSSKAGQR